MKEKLYTDAELIARFEAIREIAPNVVVREQAGLMLALIEVSIDVRQCVTTDEINRAVAVYYARIDAGLDRLRKIPESIWTEWCEVPAEELIPELAEIYHKYGRGWNQPQAH